MAWVSLAAQQLSRKTHATRPASFPSKAHPEIGSKRVACREFQRFTKRPKLAVPKRSTHTVAFVF